MRRRLALIAMLAGSAGAADGDATQGLDVPRTANEGRGAVRSATDPLHSTGCRRALDALRMQEQAAAASPSPSRSASGPRPTLEAARRAAARACLAVRADPALPPAPPPRFAQPPLAVAPVAAPPSVASPFAEPPLASSPGAARSGAPGSRTILPALLERPERPAFILSCDVLGCWASDGTRLDRVGPNLWGRRGACSVQGTLLQCP